MKNSNNTGLLIKKAGEKFVKYTPDLALGSKEETQSIRSLMQDVEQYVKQSPQQFGQAVRGTHSKSHGGCVAEIEVYDTLPEPYAQGLFSTPKKYEAIMRFSNGKSQLGPDHLLGGVVGIGLKILNVAGTKLLEGQDLSSNFDLALINAPVFFTNDATTYVNLQRLAFKELEPEEFFYNLLSAFGTKAQDEWLWEELSAFLRLAQLPVQNLLLSTYWTMAAARYGDYIAKLSIAPVSASAEKVINTKPVTPSFPEFFNESLTENLEAKEFEFEIRAQLCKSSLLMPIDRLTSEWPELLSPSIPVACIRIPKQVLLPADIVENLSINPWRVTEDHRPLGSIQRVRQAVYTASAKARHLSNKQANFEPETLADLYRYQGSC